MSLLLKFFWYSFYKSEGKPMVGRNFFQLWISCKYLIFYVCVSLQNPKIIDVKRMKTLTVQIKLYEDHLKHKIVHKTK